MSLPGDVCLFCEQSNFDHAHNCPARYDKSKLAFPDADPSPNGQAKAARNFKRRMRTKALAEREKIARELGEAQMRRIGLTLLVAAGKATLVEAQLFACIVE